MTMIYVKPAPGGRVRMPERNFIPMPATGAWVSRVDYYERLLIGGDVVICEPPAQPETVPAAPDVITDPENPARARLAPSAKET